MPGFPQGATGGRPKQCAGFQLSLPSNENRVSFPEPIFKSGPDSSNTRPVGPTTFSTLNMSNFINTCVNTWTYYSTNHISKRFFIINFINYLI